MEVTSDRKAFAPFGTALWICVLLLSANGFTYAAAQTIAYVQGNYATPSSARTVTVPFNAAQSAGNLNVIVVGWNDTTTVVQSVTDSSGNPYQLGAGPTLLSGALSQSIYYAKNIAAGTNAVTVTFSGTASYPDIRVLEYSGADLNVPVDVTAVGTGTSGTSASATANTSSPTDLIFGANTVATLTSGPGSGFTKRLLTSPDGDLAEDKMVAATGSYKATAPLSSSGNWVMQMIAFRTPSTSQGTAALAGFSCNSSSETGAGNDACTVTLTGAAPAGGTSVSLSSNNSAVTVPASVTVAAGATSATFKAKVSGVTTAQTAILTASGGGVSESFTLQLNASIVYVQGNYGTPSSARTVTVPFKAAQSAGNLNVVVVGWNDTTTVVQSVTDSSGNTYQLGAGPTLLSGALSQSIYYAKNIAAAGKNSVTVTFSGTADYPDIRVLEYSGADLNVPVDVTAVGTGTSGTSASATANTSSPTDLIFGANTVATLTSGPGSGFTKRLLTSPDGDLAEDKMVTATGSYKATAPLSSSGNWVMQMIAFRLPSTSQGAAALAGFSCNSSSETGAGNDACTVTLNGAAPAGGTSVSLSSNNSDVTVPTSVTVAAGATSATFNAAVSAVTTPQTVTLTASAGGVAKTYAIQLNAVVAGLTLSTSSLSFGSVTLNTSATQTVTLTSSGTAALTISAAAITGAGFSMSGLTVPLTLNPGQTALLTVRFDPTTAGAASGSVTLTSNAGSGSTATISLSGTGQSAAAVLSAFSCSSASETGAASDACTVTLNAAAPTGGTSVSLSSNNSAITVPASVTVAAGATGTTFTATVSAVTTAQTVTLTASAGGVAKSFTVQLNAASPTLTLQSSSISFGDVTLNSPATQSVVLTSSGTAPLTISAVSISGSEFSESGLNLPITLNPGTTATLDVVFDPTSSGAVTGAVTLTSNSSTGSTARIALSGTGQAASYTVDLTWNAPTSSSDPVAGYDVYRATGTSSSYQLLNSSVVTSTAYSDSTVQNGTAYTYYVVSVDAQGNQSTPSSTFNITIP